jgi:hypothetical protein
MLLTASLIPSKAKAVPLHATQMLGRKGCIAPIHSRPPFAFTGDRTSIARSSSPYPDTILTELPISLLYKIVIVKREVSRCFGNERLEVNAIPLCSGELCQRFP